LKYFCGRSRFSPYLNLLGQICLVTSAFLIGCGNGIKNESAQSGGSLPTPLNPSVPTAPQNPQTELTLSVSAINFGNVAVGTGSVVSEIGVANQGTSVVSGVSISIPTGPFILTGTTCPPTIPANGSCKFNVQFFPTASGPSDVIGTITGASQQGTINLSGAGAQPANLVSSVSTISFSNTESGTSSPSIVLSVQNSGGTPSEVLQTLVPIQFVATANTCAGVDWFTNYSGHPKELIGGAIGCSVFSYSNTRQHNPLNRSSRPECDRCPVRVQPQ
jgi:hypothetical protein